LRRKAPGTQLQAQRQAARLEPCVFQFEFGLAFVGVQRRGELRLEVPPERPVGGEVAVAQRQALVALAEGEAAALRGDVEHGAALPARGRAGGPAVLRQCRHGGQQRRDHDKAAHRRTSPGQASEAVRRSSARRVTLIAAVSTTTSWRATGSGSQIGSCASLAAKAGQGAAAGIAAIAPERGCVDRVRDSPQAAPQG